MFDATYAAFGTAITLLLLATVALGLRHSDPGPVVAAIGFATISAAGFGFNAVLRSGQISNQTFMQLHFPVFYLGFALILLGADLVLSVRRRRSWLLYALACVIALAYLFTPGLMAYSTSGDATHASQQVVHYLPLFIGIGMLLVEAYRRKMWLLVAFGLLVLGGVIRESGAIPSFGDAYLDLLEAFVPFTLAATCLGLLAWSRAAVLRPARQSA
jgi:hypothetical protein